MSQQILEFERDLYKTKLACGKSVLELTQYNDIPMWWLADTLFHDFIWQKINRDALRQNATGARIALKAFVFVYKYVGVYLEFFYDLFLIGLLKTVLTVAGRRKESKPSKPKILILAQDGQFRSVLDYHTKQQKKTDVFFDGLLLKLKEAKFNPIGFYPIYLHPVKGVKTYIDKLINWDVEHVPSNVYLSREAWKKQLKAQQHFRKLWKTLVHDETFRALCNFSGRNLHKVIADQFAIFLFVLFPHLVKCIEADQNLMDAENPELIVLLNEFFWRERSLVIAAKLKKIPIVALQHGEIWVSHKSYSHAPDEISSDGKFEPPYCPLPDLTCVYGPYYKKLLAEHGMYPEGSVAVTGQPRYDRIRHASEIYSRTRFCQKNDIDQDHRIVLWTNTFSYLSEQENEETIESILRTVKELDRVTLVVKPHPNDSGKYLRMIRQRLQNTANVIIAPRNADTFELLYVSDLVINKASTVTLEAVAMDKPVLILSLGATEEMMQPVVENVALLVRDRTRLTEAICALLKNSDNLKTNRRKYVRKYLHAIDGNSAQRVAQEIEKMATRGG